MSDLPVAAPCFRSCCLTRARAAIKKCGAYHVCPMNREW